MDLSMLGEVSESVENNVNEMLADLKVQLLKSSEESFPSSADKIENRVEKLLDLQGEISVQVLELQKYCWNLLTLSKQIQATRAARFNMKNQIFEHKKEIEGLIASMKTSIFTIKDHVSYLRAKLVT